MTYNPQQKKNKLFNRKTSQEIARILDREYWTEITEVSKKKLETLTNIRKQVYYRKGKCIIRNKSVKLKRKDGVLNLNREKHNQQFKYKHKHYKRKRVSMVKQYKKTAFPSDKEDKTRNRLVIVSHIISLLITSL